MIQTVLFDLDGTLLPMDQKTFVHAYFKGLVAKLQPFGFEPKVLEEGLWKAVGAEIKNDGSCTNEAAFWRVFTEIFGERIVKLKPVLEDYYKNEFQGVAKACGFTPHAKEIIDLVKQKGMTAVLATNPVFPRVATESRIRWAGLDPKDFVLYTTYENACFCKPNPKYYLDILEKLGCQPSECLMVGNDVDEDMVAESLGMRVFLLSDCLINRSQKDISFFPNGGFAELQCFLDDLCANPLSKGTEN